MSADWRGRYRLRQDAVVSGDRCLSWTSALAFRPVRQLLQNVSTGEITVEEVPAPLHARASVLVATRYSLISAGTERAALDLGRASLLEKARARPDLVQKVVESARTEGVATTYAKVRGRLGEPNALGYSLSGVVLEGCEDSPAAPGELVACAGAGRASHAEVCACRATGARVRWAWRPRMRRTRRSRQSPCTASG